VLAARVLDRSTNEGLRRALLEGVAAGDAVPVVAWQEEAATLDVGAVRTMAMPFEGGFRLSGEKHFVVGAAGAGGFVVSAQSPDGFELAWVPRDTAGCALDFEPLADGRRYGTLALTNVVVPREQVLASGEAARESLARAVDHAAVVAGAELCGIMRRALDMSLDYLRTRVQFGKPIGSFQALQHRAVDAYLQQELASAVLDEALGVLEEEPAADVRAACASRVKARCSDAALRITREAIQFHGAMGFTEDCDVGLYVKRALTVAAWLGNGTVHRRRYVALAHAAGAAS
jgi:alkylation response protein AidB-like acyl-CoA dehydrogenase